MRRQVLWLLGLVSVALLPVFLWHSPALAIRQVRVSGLAALTPAEAEETVAASALPRRTNWLHAPVCEMEARLRQLPWVAGAGVYRRIPPGLGVRVRPRVPVAVVASAEGRWELDDTGMVIRSARDGVRLPEVSVAIPLAARPGTPAVDPSVLAALAVLCPRGGGRPLPVGKIAVDQRGELCLNMNDTVAIRLGQVDDLPAKLALVRRIYNEEPGIAQKVEQIDLRFPDSPACVPRAATTPSSREAAMLPTLAHSAVRSVAPVNPPAGAAPAERQRL